MTNQIKFCQSGNSIFVQKMNANTTYDKLAPGIYSVQLCPQRGYYLEIDKAGFKLPKKTFGPIDTRAERVITTYEDRNKSTGILLTGNKGSGKTLLSETICNNLIAKGKPILVINEPFNDQGFYDLIESTGDCVVLIDEFAKKYSSRSEENLQERLLSLLDGTSSGKRLVILVENNKRLISEFIISRPGRVYYHWEYSKLEDSVVSEYCEYNNVSKDIAKQIIEVSNTCQEFSYDILATLVEEYKRFAIEPLKAVDDLNIERFTSVQNQFILTKLVNTADSSELDFEELIQPKNEYDFVITFAGADGKTTNNKPSSIMSTIEVALKNSSSETSKELGWEDGEENCSSYFNREDLVQQASNQLVYRNSEGYLAVFKPYVDTRTMGWKSYV
jgi:GTPase SAR1 family protein